MERELDRASSPHENTNGKPVDPKMSKHMQSPKPKSGKDQSRDTPKHKKRENEAQGDFATPLKLHNKNTVIDEPSVESKKTSKPKPIAHKISDRKYQPSKNGHKSSEETKEEEDEEELEIPEKPKANTAIQESVDDIESMSLEDDERLMPAFRGKLIPLTKKDVRIKHLNELRTMDNVQLFYNLNSEGIIFFTITTNKKYNIEYIFESDEPSIKHLSLKDTGIVDKYIDEFERIPEEARTNAQAHALHHLTRLNNMGQEYLDNLVADHKASFKKPPSKKNKNNEIPSDVAVSADGTILVGAKRTTVDGRSIGRNIKRKKEEFPVISVPTNKTVELIDVRPHLIDLEKAKLDNMKKEFYLRLALQRNTISNIMSSTESIYEKEEFENVYDQ